MGAKVSIQDQVFQMKMTSKRLEKSAQKALKQEKATKKKVKDAIAAGQMEIAKVRVFFCHQLPCVQVGFLPCEACVPLAALRVS